MNKIAPLLIGFCGIWALSCSNSTKTENSNFTKADSLTESYLNLRDSIYQVWNILLKSEQDKVQKLESALLQLIRTNPDEADKFEQIKQRLYQLERIRYTDKTFSNPHVVEEYDKAGQFILREVMQNLDSSIHPSDAQNLKAALQSKQQQLTYHRELYNHLATQYNQFLDHHKNLVKEIDQQANLKKKQLFTQTTAGR